MQHIVIAQNLAVIIMYVLLFSIEHYVMVSPCCVTMGFQRISLILMRSMKIQMLRSSVQNSSNPAAQPFWVQGNTVCPSAFQSRVVRLPEPKILRQPHLPFTSSTFPSLSLVMPSNQFFLFDIPRLGSVFLFGHKRDKHCFILASNFKSNSKGSSLVVQQLGLNTFTAVTRVQSLIGELKSCKPSGVSPAQK